MSKSESSDNVYKKLQRCRSELKKLPIKPTGNNKFAGYTYMELGDFLPHIVDLCNEYGLCPVVCFESGAATLTIYNIHNPEDKVIFTSPMSTAALKGCHEVQNLGAVETYIKRYLFTHAFDIVEHDALDSTHGKEATKEIAGNSDKGKPPAAPAAKESPAGFSPQSDERNEWGEPPSKNGDIVILYIEEIEKKEGVNAKTRKPWTSWTLKVGDSKWGTFNSSVAKLAEEAKAAGKPVEVAYITKEFAPGKTSNEIVTLRMMDDGSAGGER